jgi:outer membrane lipoprotein-sorting protein
MADLVISLVRASKLTFIVLGLFVSSSLQAIETDELLRHIDELWRGESSSATMKMTINTSRYSRSMTMKSWSKGDEYSLVSISEPVKDKGVATLKVESNIWNYLPKINRVTKVPSSMMSGSWMGSHFTNDDLVRESSFEDDYDSSISFSGERNGKEIYELSSIPKESAAVVWGKVIMEIDQGTLAPVSALYYDESGTLIRTIRFDQVEKVGERHIPMKMTLLPEDKPDEKTEVVYSDFKFDIDVKEDFFSLQNLRKRR